MNKLKEFILKELSDIDKQLKTEFNMPRINTLKGCHMVYHKILEYIKENDNEDKNSLTQEQCEILANLPKKQIIKVEYKTMTPEEIVELLNKPGENK